MAKKEHIPAALRAEVMASHNCCVVCGTWDAIEVGHLIAESKGGKLEISNLVRMCGNCNRKQCNRNVAFAAWASYSLEPAIVTSRRAYWAKYCGSANCKNIKPYRPLC